MEPTRFPEPPEEQEEQESPENAEAQDLSDEDPDANKSEQQIIDEITGQTNLFSDEDF